MGNSPHPVPPPRAGEGTGGGVLVVGPSWVGDMVMAQSLFMRLKALTPDTAIDVLAPGWSLPLIARMPQVRRGIEIPLGHGQFGFGVRRRLGLGLSAHGYSQAIVLPGSWKSALVPFFAGIPRRTGYRGEMRYGLLNDLRHRDGGTTVRQFVALADAAGEIPQPRLRVDPAEAVRVMGKLGLKPGPAVALMPGAEYGPAKRWPAEHFGVLAMALADSGVQPWIFGSAKEFALGEDIRRASGDTAINLCGKTSLPDVVDLAAQCKAVVTNDSGLMHVAAAAGAPIVALYGSSDPNHTPPLADKTSVQWLQLSCSPCFERTCPLYHYRCLRDLRPRAVHDALRALVSL